VKRFRFSLETALRLQKRKQKWIENQLRAAFQAMQREEDAIAACKESLVRLAKEFETAAVGGSLPANWSAYPRNAERIEGEQAVAKDRLAKAKEAFRRIDEERKRIAQYCEALAQLRQQAWDKHRAESEKAAQLATDEFVMRNWMEPAAQNAAPEDGS